MNVYRRKELNENRLFEKSLELAAEIWRHYANIKYREKRDLGPVNGYAGIYMDIIEHRQRQARRTLVLSSPNGLRGEVVPLAGLKEASNFLKTQGFDNTIDAGPLD